MIKVNIPSVLEVLFPVVLKIENRTVLRIACPIPAPLGTYIDDFILLINELPTQLRILIFGDFNLHHMLPENVAKVDPLIKNFNLPECSQYSTRING